ncbi:uncharacterized protein PpBr36_10054 [Pyricularia pennisetigena]|uniref:uncharacterized protein n=1 Tax=Pyricularia pennisetigena TaxID=1578925 RepID=UPI001151FB03|nr:uncharacterized protein PpBr36_10054 [Pyricularia pennisetigena]TLS22229.1 hypothetical protein PpBr36_10054 [Pyricularia pennisetigena]
MQLSTLLAIVAVSAASLASAAPINNEVGSRLHSVSRRGGCLGCGWESSQLSKRYSGGGPDLDESHHVQKRSSQKKSGSANPLLDMAAGVPSSSSSSKKKKKSKPVPKVNNKPLQESKPAPYRPSSWTAPGKSPLGENPSGQ